MSSESKTQDWSKPAAMAIPKGGYFKDKVEQGRYGPRPCENMIPLRVTCWAGATACRLTRVVRLL